MEGVNLLLLGVAATGLSLSGMSHFIKELEDGKGGGKSLLIYDWHH